MIRSSDTDQKKGFKERVADALPCLDSRGEGNGHVAVMLQYSKQSTWAPIYSIVYCKECEFGSRWKTSMSVFFVTVDCCQVQSSLRLADHSTRRAVPCDFVYVSQMVE